MHSVASACSVPSVCTLPRNRTSQALLWLKGRCGAPRFASCGWASRGASRASPRRHPGKAGGGSLWQETGTCHEERNGYELVKCVMPNGGNHEEQQEMQGVEGGEGRGARGDGEGPGERRGRRTARRRSRSDDAMTRHRESATREAREVGPLGTVPQPPVQGGGLQRRKRSADGRQVEGVFQQKRSGSRESTSRNTRQKEKKEKK